MQLKFFVLLIWLLSAKSCFSQQGEDTVKRSIILFTELATQKNPYAGIQMTIARIYSIPHWGMQYAGPFVGAETNFSSSNYVFGVKGGYEVSFLLFTGRINVIDYISKGKNDLRFRPEFGLSLLQTINITWGYNAPLSKQRLPQVGSSRFCINVTLNKKIWNGFSGD